jgi:peptidoglycan/LPS O-acetylase OafA/YrhL
MSGARDKRPELTSLTALRFFAAFHVLVFHYFAAHAAPAGGLAGIAHGIAGLGYTGVSFFFVLSGFILCYTYGEADFRAGPTRRLFFAARVSRILPVYLLALAIALPFAAGFLRNSEGVLALLRGASFLTAPVALQAWLPGAACTWNCAAWSVSCEAFFYALFPMLLAWLIASPRRFALGAAAAMVASLALSLLLWSRFGTGSLVGADAGLPPETVLLKQFIKMFPALRLAEFLAGMLLYDVYRRHRARLPGRPLFAAGALGYGALLAIGDALSEPLLHNGLFALPAAAIILGAACGGAPRLFANAGLVHLGRASYSLYLLHGPLYAAALTVAKRFFASESIGFAAALGLAMAALAVSSLVYTCFEEPMRARLMRRAREALAGDRAAARARAA